jgi:hypothetical protein
MGLPQWTRFGYYRGLGRLKTRVLYELTQKSARIEPGRVRRWRD